MPDSLHWLISTNTGLYTRVAIGGAIFLTLALVDLRRQGRRATRWREYLFLLAIAGLAMVYGALNDLITSRISWEYFLYGKDLLPVLGARTPPDSVALSWEAAKVGMKATWSAGLLIAVAMLIANNPRDGLRQLTYSRLFRFVPGIFLGCVLCGIVLGIAASRGGLVWISNDFAEMVHHHEWHPYRFMAVFGVHLGGYAGGALGAVWTVLMIRRERRAEPHASDVRSF